MSVMKDEKGEVQAIEEKTSVYAGLSKVEQHCFPSITKEEIIEKYIDMKSHLLQAEKIASHFYSLMVDALKKHELLKAKYPDLNAAEYNPEWSWVNKIVYVLRKTDRPLLSSEMIDLLLPHEPRLQWSHQRPQTFSAHLHKALKYKRIAAYKRGGSRGYFYVLPEWMESPDALLRAYEEKIFFV